MNDGYVAVTGKRHSLGERQQSLQSSRAVSQIKFSVSVAPQGLQGARKNISFEFLAI